MITRIPYSDHEEWLGIRSNYIGGSEAGAIVGLNPYESAYSLWAKKTKKMPPFEGNLATKVGTYLEDFVAKLFEEQTGKAVRKQNFTLVNDKYPWACANVDRLIIGEDAGLEIKTTSALSTKKFANGEFPTQYYAQCMHYLAVTEKKKWYLAVLIGNNDFRIYELERDEDEIAALMEAEEAFWELVQKNTPPAADGRDVTADAIKTVWAESIPDSTTDLTPVAVYLDMYKALQKQEAEIARQKAECQAHIELFMEDNERGEFNEYKVSWKTQSRKTFDKKAYEKDNGPIEDKYYKESVSRPFKITIKEN